MTINVKVKTKECENKIKKISANEYSIKTTAVPEKGKANKAIIKILAEELGVAKSRMRIVNGEKSRNKVMEIV